MEEPQQDTTTRTALTTSLGSTYSQTSETSINRLTLTGSLRNDLVLHQTAPFLLLGTGTETPSPIQSWKAVLAEFKGPRRLWSVCIFSLMASLTSVLAGYALGYPSSTLMNLRDLKDSRAFQHRSSQEDAFGAMAPLGAILGAGISGWLADVLGRKPTLVLTGVPNVLGWGLLGVSLYIKIRPLFLTCLMLGRFITGIGMGWAMLVAPMYIAEISVPVLRGLFSALPQLALALGILLAYCIGFTLQYDYSALAAVGISLLGMVLTLCIPESPRFLISKGKRDKANKVLKWLRGPKTEISGDIFEFDNMIYKQRKLSCSEFCIELRQRKVYLPFVLLFFVLVFQQLSGINAVIFYGAPILQSASITNDSEFDALLAIGLTEFLTTIITVFIVDLFGRKYMLILSTLVMACGCTGLATHLYITTKILCDQCTQGFAIVSVILLIVGFSLGLGAIPLTLISELLPLRVRGTLGGILSGVYWGFAALVTGLYLEFSAKVTEGVAWWTFACINVVSMIFIVLFLPETKGKKLETIERQMLHKYKLCS